MPFSFAVGYLNDDRVQGGARIGIFDVASGQYAPLRVAFAGKLIQNRRAGTVEVAGPARIQIGHVPVLVTASLATQGPKIELAVACDSLTPERVVASLPPPLLGPLPAAGVRGSWDYRLGFRLDVSQPDSVGFHAEVIPHDLELEAEKSRLNLLTLDQPFVATIHLPRGRTAKAFDHTLHRLWQHLFRQSLVRPDPIEQARRILGQYQRVALRFPGAIHDTFQFGEIFIHGGECFVLLQTEINGPARRLCRCDSNHVG